jgi:hypothetical protein
MHPFTTLRYYTAALLLLPLAVSTATAGPTTSNPPPTKRQPVAAKSKAASAVATTKQAAPTAVVAPATLVASLAPAAAPQTVQLKGIVLAPDGRPCAGASVYPAGAPRQLTVTDAQGAFTLAVPAGAAVSLRVDYFGEGSSRVEVPAPGPELLRITLGN